MINLYFSFLSLLLFRQGQMCSRCLRSMDDRLTVNDEQSSLAPTEECEEDEERSLLDLEGNRDDNASEHSQAAYRSSMSIKVRNCFYFKTLLFGLMRG